MAKLGADSLADLDARIGPQPVPPNGADYDGAQAPSADVGGTRAETPHDKPLPKLVPIRFVEGEIPKPREVDCFMTVGFRHGRVTLLQGDGGDWKNAAGAAIALKLRDRALPVARSLRVEGCTGLGFFT